MAPQRGSLVALTCLLLPGLVTAFLPAPCSRSITSTVVFSAVDGASAEVKPYAAAAAARRPRREVKVSDVVETKGGYMAKVTVKNFNDETHHTVITSKELMDNIRKEAGKSDASVEDYYQAVFRFMFSKAMPLKNTEGMIDASIFPINYFAVKQLGYFHEDAEEGIAKALKDL